MEIPIGFITLSPMALTPPICSPELGPDWNSRPWSPIPTQSALVTPMVSPDPFMGENTPTGLLPLKLGPLLDANVQQSPSLTQYFLDEDEASSASIVEKSWTEDSTNCDVIPADPRLRLNPSAPKDTWVCIILKIIL